MIKIKNVDKKSYLHKHYANLVTISVSCTNVNQYDLSNGMIASAFIPVAGKLDKLFISTDTDITASNGYTVALTNGQRSAALVNQTMHSQISGEADVTANRAIGITGTNTTEFSAGSHIEFRISGSIGTARIFAMAVIDIDERNEK